jgi:hypothetical protein
MICVDHIAAHAVIRADGIKGFVIGALPDVRCGAEGI